jgi:hypothetical protein
MPETPHNRELENLASALASLAPSAGRLDRDQVLFRAGQASARRRRWPWPVASAALAALALGLGVVAVRNREPRAVERIVYVPSPLPVSPSPISRNEPFASAADSESPGTDSPPTSPLSYYRLEQVASRWGVDGLPIPGSDTIGEADTKPERLIDRRMQDAYFSELTR